MFLVHDTDTTYTRDDRKFALNDLQNFALAWMDEHGDAFPALRDALHEVDTAIDNERGEL